MFSRSWDLEIGVGRRKDSTNGVVEEMDKDGRIWIRRKPRRNRGFAKAVADYLKSNCYMYTPVLDLPPLDSLHSATARSPSAADAVYRWENWWPDLMLPMSLSVAGQEDQQPLQGDHLLGTSQKPKLSTLISTFRKGYPQTSLFFAQKSEPTEVSAFILRQFLCHLTKGVCSAVAEADFRVNMGYLQPKMSTDVY